MNKELPQKIFLIDHNFGMVQNWINHFKGESKADVEVFCGDYFLKHADAMVSPANSHGIMDGGLDKPIRDRIRNNIQKKVQDKIIKDFHGELSVGQAMIVETENSNWPYLISAPTMRVPENIEETINPYLAFRAILLAIKNFNKNGKKINSVICSGLGTGIGRVSYENCAFQMKAAFDNIYSEAKIPSFNDIRVLHSKMRENK